MRVSPELTKDHPAMIAANLAYFRGISTNKPLEIVYMGQNMLRLGEDGDGNVQCERDWIQSVRCPKGWVIKSHEQIKRVSICVLVYMCTCVCMYAKGLVIKSREQIKRVSKCVCVCLCMCVCVGMQRYWLLRPASRSRG